MAERDLSKLTNDELRRLQAELPPIVNDASNPVNDERNAIVAEGKRRGMW
jgi:hypothetical protein